MNKISIFRTLNTELKYHSIKEYIGMEIPIDISKKGEEIENEIKSLIEENLNIKVKSTKGNNIEGTIAKYGLLDISFEIETDYKSDENKGIQILKENGWIDKENSDEYKDEDFFDEIIEEIKKNKDYLKINATVIGQKKSWFREKSYLLQQMVKGQKINPLPKDRIQVFKINDMCFTNYSGIWLWKYFYM
ncbi:hypothetical protein [Aquimarina sp. AU58]|uniref:hypothetical protein n=1 Tax=Aquimarina sp. AU58 TaxID=1874112 RepID=UPI000D6E3DF0|nr:hypothetical protein [Aquimarina sp. AU58]